MRAVRVLGAILVVANLLAPVRVLAQPDTVPVEDEPPRPREDATSTTEDSGVAEAVSAREATRGAADDAVSVVRAVDPGPPEDAPGAREGFTFGSYGRVVVASDLVGGAGRDADFVRYGSRLDEDSYVELELARHDVLGTVRSRVVATLAIAGPLFHYDGRFDDRVAVRNLFLEVEGVPSRTVALWAGSRMARGDDVYLFDLWPLDELNVIGGGASLTLGAHVVSLCGGLSRPDDPFQRQSRLAMAPGLLAPVEVVVLDRPRLVLAARGLMHVLGVEAPHEPRVQLVAYGEAHRLPEGRRARPDGPGHETLAADEGWLAGLELAGTLARWHGQLFVRWARGLGAYDPLGVPFRPEATVHDTGRAEEWLAALNVRWELPRFGLLAAGWWRRFRDADPTLFQRAVVTEGAFALRPHVFLGAHTGVAFELGWQRHEAASLDDRTGRPVGGGAWKLGFVPFVTPRGPGLFTRPHLRAVYALTARDDGARSLYPEADARSRRPFEHFLGVGAEWWFETSSRREP
ncbi:MAG: carbohydrate porin [Myxococcota bacterium]|nr:carbohydrate porin [Myxococcota bacterium]